MGSGLVVLLLIVACTQPEVKPTEDNKRIERMDSFMDGLRHLVRTNDIERLTTLYPQDQQHEIENLPVAMRSIQQPQLDFFIDRMVIDQDAGEVALHWEFHWKRLPDLRPVTRRGNAIFHIGGTEELFLKSVEGDNPFLAPLAEPILLP